MKLLALTATCHGKNFEWPVDDEGKIFRTIPVTEELAEVVGAA